METLDTFLLGKHPFKSRLILGTGKFSSPEKMKAAIDASKTEMVTVAVRRVDLANHNDTFIEALNPKDCIFLPNTSGARTAEEAIRCARIGREMSKNHWVKLEVTPEPNYLLPDPIETLKAAEILVKENFIVLPYINADPILAKHLANVGCAAIMPLGSPIGSNMGLKTKDQLRIIIEQATTPVIIDAGIGAPSQAAEAMEMGADAVLVNTAIATATNPAPMALAFKQAVQAGRSAYLAGLASEQKQAEASSPLTGFLNVLGPN